MIASRDTENFHEQTQKRKSEMKYEKMGVKYRNYSDGKDKSCLPKSRVGGARINW